MSQSNPPLHAAIAQRSTHSTESLNRFEEAVMNTVARFIFYILFILGGLLFIFMGLVGAGAGFGHGGPNTSPIGLFLMGGIAAILTGFYGMIRGLGMREVSPSGSVAERFASRDLVILVIVWGVCLVLGALIH
jgi:hypothetical protein